MTTSEMTFAPPMESFDSTAETGGRIHQAPADWRCDGRGALGRKARLVALQLVVAVALANKNARIIWALLTHGGVYKDPAVAAA